MNCLTISLLCFIFSLYIQRTNSQSTVNTGDLDGISSVDVFDRRDCFSLGSRTNRDGAEG